MNDAEEEQQHALSSLMNQDEFQAPPRWDCQLNGGRGCGHGHASSCTSSDRNIALTPLQNSQEEAMVCINLFLNNVYQGANCANLFY
jgi:hypothetical protein